MLLIIYVVSLTVFLPSIILESTDRLEDDSMEEQEDALGLQVRSPASILGSDTPPPGDPVTA